MTRAPQASPERARGTASSDSAIAVVSAYGTFRLLLILLTAWTVFAGFSLLTQSIGALTFGADDSATERIAGAFMLTIAPVYALIAWRRDQYRLLIWMPYAAQLAVIVPLTWAVFTADDDAGDGVLMLIISAIFLALLVYVWSSSHPLQFFQPEDADAGDEEDDEEEEDDEDLAEVDDDEGEPRDGSGRRRRYRRV